MVRGDVRTMPQQTYIRDSTVKKEIMYMTRPGQDYGWLIVSSQR